jgi:hypothetical protein
MGHTAPDYNRVHWRHGGLTPPALVLVCGRLPAKQRFLRCTNAHSTRERRASARRGSVNRALCGRNRVLFGDDRLHDQERRASARRGSQNRTLCRCNRAMFDDDRTTTKSGGSFSPHMHVVSVSLVAVAFVAPRLAYASRSCVAVTLVCREMRDSRCGPTYTTKSGGRQPAVPTKRPGDSQRHIPATVSALATRLRKGTHARW